MNERNRKRRSSASAAVRKHIEQPAPQLVPQLASELAPPAPEPISATAPNSTVLTFQSALGESPAVIAMPIESAPGKAVSRLRSASGRFMAKPKPRWKQWLDFVAKKVKSTQFQKSDSSLVLSRAWSWLHRKYTVSTKNKRLRVAETVALGEKRFVALVSIEGREFLIGGGAQGVSLLAHLGRASQPQDAFRAALSAIGDSE